MIMNGEVESEKCSSIRRTERIYLWKIKLLNNKTMKC